MISNEEKIRDTINCLKRYRRGLNDYDGDWSFFDTAVEELEKLMRQKAKINFVKVEHPGLTRKNILETAINYVCSDRNNQYGSPEDSFKVIASLWTAYLDKPITAKDVAAMMVLFKMARVKTGTAKADNWIDAAGYCACGGECEEKEKSE